MKNYILPIAAVVLGGLSILIWKPKEIRSVKQLLAFSGAFLLSITVLEMLPNVYQSHGVVVGYWVLGGLVSVIFRVNFQRCRAWAHSYQSIVESSMGDLDQPLFSLHS